MAWPCSFGKRRKKSKKRIKVNKRGKMNHIAMRDAFFDKIYEIAKKDSNVIVISADMGAPSLDKFRKDLASQFINVGIAEENMVTIATGLALSKKKVFIYAIMPFVTLRCYEMIKVNLSLMNVPVTCVGVGAGFSYDESGPTHHCTEDIAIMRTLPNMTILNASDSVMAAKLAEISYGIIGPSYVRLDRKILPVIYDGKEDFSAGLKRLKKSKEMYIISSGNMVHRAKEVSERLAKFGIKAGVIDLYRLKPLNESLLLRNISEGTRLVTIEEHLLIGGLGSIIAEFLIDQRLNIPLRRFGIQDKYYYAYGGRENIQALCDLDTESITRKILEWAEQ
jgi:transketolase